MKRRGKKRRSSEGGECRGNKTAFVTETNTTGSLSRPCVTFCSRGSNKSPPNQQPEDQTLHRVLIDYTSAHLPPSRNRRAAGLRKEGRGFVSRLLNRDGRCSGSRVSNIAREREKERGSRVKDRVESEDLIAPRKERKKKKQNRTQRGVIRTFPEVEFLSPCVNKSVTITK